MDSSVVMPVLTQSGDFTSINSTNLAFEIASLYVNKCKTQVAYLTRGGDDSTLDVTADFFSDLYPIYVEACPVAGTAGAEGSTTMVHDTPMAATPKAAETSVAAGADALVGSELKDAVNTPNGRGGVGDHSNGFRTGMQGN